MLGSFAISGDNYRNGEYRVCVCCGKHLRRGLTYHTHAIGKKCADALGLTVKAKGCGVYIRPSEAHITATMARVIESSAWTGA